MKSLLPSTLCSLVLLSWTSISAQQAIPSVDTDDASQKTEVPYQIIVTPLIMRSDLRDSIVKLEEDFVARFNELNTDDDYDVKCYDYTATNSHTKTRVCEPNFLIEERGRNASEAAFRLSQAKKELDLYQIFVYTPKMLRNEVHREYDTLQSKLEEMTNSDQSLRAMAIELDKLTASLKGFDKED